jgi:hypothetical protein
VRTIESRLPFLILLAGALISVTPVLALALFSFPSADDYCVAVEVRKGFWHMQFNTYLNWTGRYSATLLQTAFTQWDLATIYPWFCVLTVVATLLAVRAAVGALYQEETSRVGLATAAACATAVFIGRLPSPTEAFFWMTSAVTYQWAIVVYLVWVALLVASTGRERLTIARRIVIVTLTAALPGFNEVLAPVVLLTIVGVGIIERVQTKRTNDFFVSLIAVAVVMTAVSLLAPGNAIRSNSYPDIPTRHNLGFAAVQTARQSVRFLSTFGSYPLLWVAAAAAWWWGRRHLPDAWTPRNALGVGAMAIALPVAVVYLTLFPLYWEYGEVNYTGEGRTYNVTYFLFVAATVWAVGCVLDHVSRHWSWLRTPSHPRRAAIDVILACALAALMVSSPGSRRAFGALPHGPDYLEAQQEREAFLRSTSNRGKPLLVDAMAIRPDGLFWGGIQPDEGHWINRCVASYYGLASVRIRRPDGNTD